MAVNAALPGGVLHLWRAISPHCRGAVQVLMPVRRFSGATGSRITHSFAMRALVLALLIASPATAQSVFDRARGSYGSVADPLQSCTANPHELSFLQSPPHAILRWAAPRLGPDGRMTREDVYDVRGATGSTLSLQREGDAPLPETGRRPVWILRLTDDPDGYCWGREDWSPVRCINAAVRCAAVAPTS